MLNRTTKLLFPISLFISLTLNCFSQIHDAPVYISHNGQIIHPDNIPEQYKTDREFPDSWIVEFKGEPMSKITEGLKSATNRNYQATFNTFENDLNNISSSGEGLKSGKILRINRKFKNTFFGASVDNISSSALDQIKKLPYVKTVYRNEVVKGHLSESAELINAPTARANHGVTGAGVKVGIVDSGIDYMHPALGGGFGEGFKVAGGYDFVNDDTDPMDDYFHGTHVAGIVASGDATYMGIAPDVTLYALKCINQYNEGQEDDIIAAIEWALDPNGDGNFEDKLDIINLSLGSSNGNALDAKSIAVNNVSEAGILCVVSAGNEGELGFNTIGSPGTAERALTVGNCSKELTIAQSSSGGPSGGNGYIKPEVVAPGENITSTVLNDGFQAYSGTSQAAPHVTGICALLKEKHPDWTPEQIKSAMIQSCTPLTDVEVMKQGAGLVDAEKALSCETLIYPAIVNLGNISFKENFYTKEVQLSFKNESQTEKTYFLSQKNRRYGTDVSFSESEFTLNSGAEKQVSATFKIPVGAIPNEVPFTEANALDGLIEITEDGKSVNLPWAIIKGVKVKFKVIGEWDSFFSNFFITNESNYYNGIDGYNASDSGFTILVKPGVYHLLFDGTKLIENENFFNHRIVLKDSLNIVADTSILIDLTQTHLLSFEGVDNLGNLLSEGEYYRKNIGIKLPDENLRTEYVVNIFDDYNAIFLSSFNSIFTIFPFEYLDEYLDKSKYTIINHEPIYSLSSPISLSNNPSDFLNTNIKLNIPEDSPDPLILIPYRIHGKEEYYMRDPDFAFGGFGFSHNKKDLLDSVDIYIQTNNSNQIQFGFNIGVARDSQEGMYLNENVEYLWSPLKLVNNQFRMIPKSSSHYPVHYLPFQNEYSLPAKLIYPRFTLFINPDQIYGTASTNYGGVVELVYYGMQEEQLPLSNSYVHTLLVNDTFNIINENIYQMGDGEYPRINVNEGNYFYYLFNDHSTGLIKYKTSCFAGKKGSEQGGAGPNIKLFQLYNSKSKITNQIELNEQATVSLITTPSVSWLNPELFACIDYKPEGSFIWNTLNLISDSINYEKNYNYLSCKLPLDLNEGYYDLKIKLINELGETTELTYYAGLIIGSPEKTTTSLIGEVQDTSCYAGELITYEIPVINYTYDSCIFEVDNIYENIEINIVGNEMTIKVDEQLNPDSYPVEIRLLKNNTIIDNKIFNLNVFNNDLFVKNPIPDTVVYVNSPPLKIPLDDVFASKTGQNFNLLISNNSNPDLVTPEIYNDTLFFPFEEFKFGKSYISLKAYSTDSVFTSFLIDRSLQNTDISIDKLPYYGIQILDFPNELDIKAGTDTIIDLKNLFYSQKSGENFIDKDIYYKSNSNIETKITNDSLFINTYINCIGQTVLYFHIWDSKEGSSQGLKFQLKINVYKDGDNRFPICSQKINDVVFESIHDTIKTFDLNNYFFDPDGDELTFKINIENKFVANGIVKSNTLIILTTESVDYYFHKSDFLWKSRWEKWTRASVTASDNQGATVTEEFWIRYNDCENNQEIVLFKNFDNAFEESQKISQLSYNLYEYFNWPNYEVFSSNPKIVNPLINGFSLPTLEFKTGGNFGSCNITIKAFDEQCGNSVSQSFNVTVIPEIVEIKTTQDTVIICKNEYFSLNSFIKVYDSEGNDYDLNSGITWQEIGQGIWDGNQEYICNWSNCRTYIAEYNGLYDTLTICPSQTEDFFDVRYICEGDSAFIGGKWVWEQDYYRDTLQSVQGCDSTGVVFLSTIQFINLPEIRYQDSDNICFGDSIMLSSSTGNSSYIYEWSNGEFGQSIYIHESGEYRLRYRSINNADCFSEWSEPVSIIFNEPSYNEEYISICEGDSAFLGGKWVGDQGYYRDTLQSVQGCDSIIFTNLSFYPTYQPEINFDNNTLSTPDTYQSYEWYKNDGALLSTVDTLTITESGDYYLIVTDENGCINISATVNAVYTSVNSFAFDNFKYSIIPNPNPGKFTFRIDSNFNEKLKLKLVDPSGKIIEIRDVYPRANNTELFDISHLSKGIYYLTISTNKFQQSEKIVIQ